MENKITVQLGRPVNPNSVRQQRIAEREAKRAAGELKRGRPVVEGSKRQQVLAERAEKVANGGTLKRGRPIVADSKRQLELAAKAAKQNVSVEDTVKEMMS
jgi:hypothetical protein